MKILTLFAFFISATLFAQPSHELLFAIDNNDEEAIISYFNSIDTMSNQEANQLIHLVYEHFQEKYGINIFNQTTPAEFFSSDFLNKIKTVSRNPTSLHVSPIFIQPFNLYKYPRLLSSRLGNYSSKVYDFFLKRHHLPTLAITSDNEDDIPPELVVGYLEILVGGLIWIIPNPVTKTVGAGLVMDGIRRSGNGLCDQDRLNKEKMKKG